MPTSARSKRASWVDKPMRWAQLTLVEDDPLEIDLPFWLDYFRGHAQRRRCLSAGGCVAYYPTEIPFHHRSRLPGRPRPVRRTGRGLPAAGHGRARPDRPARDLRRRTAGAPRLDRRRRRGHASAATGPRPRCGSPALGAVQLRVHDRGPPGDHRPLQGRRRSSSTAGPAPGCATASTAGTTFRAATGHELPRGGRPAGPGHRAYLVWQQRAALRALAALGRRGPEPQPRLVRHPERRRPASRTRST